MGLVFALGYAALVMAAADQIMLWLERRGHVNWRRTGRKALSTVPRVRLDTLLEDSSPSR
ncbi:hypothetical protein ABZT47_30530 [Sphaerisporangium sp. NPDC005289]|uniref:Uncharacterized protein n=1 Tax=Sphaerisporangium rhizosphaerae TaxID=2269375 RepID=A0ABW2PIU7_9ACTN